MTDRRRPVPVAAIAGALFCVVLIYLALQVRAGNDPAIGAGKQAPASPARPVVVRRVVVTRLIEEDAPATAGSAAPASAPAAEPASAAATTAPAPAPAASAPVVSRGS
jgi:hypothetical protein